MRGTGRLVGDLTESGQPGEKAEEAMPALFDITPAQPLVFKTLQPILLRNCVSSQR